MTKACDAVRGITVEAQALSRMHRDKKSEVSDESLAPWEKKEGGEERTRGTRKNQAMIAKIRETEGREPNSGTGNLLSEGKSGVFA